MRAESDSTDRGASARRFEIEGRTLGFPALFQDGSSAVGLFHVPSRAAQALICDSGFEVAELWPGRAGFSLSCVHYRKSDCDVYNEVSMAFFVKPKHGRHSRIPYVGTWLDIARGNAATHVWKLPVTNKIALDAGVLMWGFPKTGKKIQPRGVSAVYSNYEGAPHVTYLEHEYRDVGVSFGGGRLSLGDHPISNQLRGLGLPRRPLVATWMGHLSFTVGAPQKL
jgi:hypothetical protein